MTLLEQAHQDTLDWADKIREVGKHFDADLADGEYLCPECQEAALKENEDPLCEGCGNPNRTMCTSDGWVNMCINPACEINGVVLLGGPAIKNIDVKMTKRTDGAWRRASLRAY